MEMALTMRQLHERGPMCRGLAVDSEGVVLGTKCILVRRSGRGYQVADFDKTGQLLFALGRHHNVQHLELQLNGIRRALDDGNLAKAQILGLQTSLAGISSDELARIEVSAALLKYDPAQPRDNIGRWTTGGGSSDAPEEDEALQPPEPAFLQSPTPEPVFFEPSPSAPIIVPPPVAPAVEELAPETVGLLSRFAAVLGGSLALGGLLALIPTNGTNIHEGDIPGRPDLTYRLDEGELMIDHVDDQGNLHRVYEGFPDAAGLYRDSTGRVIGQRVGTGAVFNLGSVPMFGGPSAMGPTAASDPTSHDSGPSSSDPKDCPDPTPESINGRDPDVVRYQSQITGLEPGQIVHLNGRNFDGCDEETGDMKEAKHGQDWFFTVPVEDRPSLNEYKKIMAQAEGQSNAAGERRVIWYFSNPEAATYWREKFKEANLDNLGTKWEALEAKKFWRHREFFWEMVA
jgi:hypothetical protein